MKTTFYKMHLLLLFTSVFAMAQLAGAAGTTRWSGAGADQNWSTAGNWTSSGGSTPPAAGDTVAFGGGAFPLSTNVNGAVDNIVDVSTTIASLLYTNTSTIAPNSFHTTQINANQTLTVNGVVTVGFAGQTTTVAMTGTGNFTANNTGGAFNIGGSSGSTMTATLTLANGTNTITVSKLSIGESAGSNGRQCIMNLGNSNNIINADNINLGTGKAQGNIQFPAASVNGTLQIRNTAGTGRATIFLGNSSSSGSATARGNLLLAGHQANIMAGLLEISGTNTAAGTGGATGSMTMDIGTLDATTIRMGENSPGNNTHPTSAGTFTFGGNPTNSATLIVNSPSGPGGGSFVVSAATGPWFDDNNAPRTTLTGAGTFNLNTNGTAQIYSSLTEAAPTNNTGTINITGGTLIMEAATNTIGTPAIPIDNMTLDFATLQFSEDGSSLNAAVKNLTLNDTNVVNIAALPPISALPTVIPIITYTSLTLGSGTFSLGLGTLPGTYHGYVTNDGVSSINLVITSGPIVAKPVVWGGGVNNNWDTNSLNWTNAGVAVKFSEGDFVAFDDKGRTNNVNLVAPHTPASLKITNNVLNYKLSGDGSIIGASSLVKYGNASLTLAASGGDNFAGGIVVHGGTVVLDDPNSNISGGLTNDAGTVVQIGNNDANGALPSGNLDIEGALVYNRSDNINLATVISGGGALTQSGNGTLVLSVVNTYTGSTTVGGGTLALSGAGSVASALTAVNGATLDLTGSDGSGSHFSVLTLNGGIVAVSNILTTAAALNLTNATISLVADAGIGVGGQAIITATSVATGGPTNTIKVASFLNMPTSPTLPVIVPLVSYTSSTFGGGFNIGLVPPAGFGGYVSNDVANSSLDLVITSSPQDITWNGGSSTGNNWSDAANWSGTAIGAVDALFFDGTARLINTNNTAAGTPYAGVTFNGGAGVFTLNGNPINLLGTIVNNSSSTQAVNLGLTVNGNCTLDGGGGGGALAINGGVTNISNSAKTVTLAGTGTLNDLWATNSGASGGGQLRFLIGTAGGNWTILDGSGTGALVPAGNVALAIVGAGAGGEIDFGTMGSAPNVDVGAGSLTLDGNNNASIETFNLNNGTLKVNAVVMPGGGSGNLNVNGGTLVLGTNSFAGGGGAGGAILTATLNSGAIYSTNGGVFQVTARCPGTFTINGGLLQCGTLEISAGQASSGNGIFNLDGGKLICTAITCGLFSGNASSTMNFNGGKLQANASSASFISQNNLAPMTVNVSTNGAIIDTAGFNDTIGFPMASDPALAGGTDGGLTKLGAGTLTLSSANSYIGLTAVSNGTLLVSGLITSDTKVAGTGILAGSGSVNGNVTTVNNGTVAPGTPVATGTLTVSSNLTFSLTGTNVMKLNAATSTNDVLSVAGTLTYGGTLNLVNLAGTLTASSTFTLFKAGASGGAFARLVPAIPGAGLGWNTNTLSTDGILRLVATVNTTPTNLTAVVSGNLLTLSWPADHTGWRLQAQTNSLASGLRTNWFDVAGSTSVNSVNVSINPANGTVFYRMVYP